MWTPGALLVLLVAGASALAWKPNNEYQYNVMTKTLTSLEGLNDTTSGVAIRAKLTVQPQSESQLFARLQQVQYADVQEEVIDGQIPEEVQQRLSWKTLEAEAIEKPIEITLKSSAIKEVKVSKDVPVWAVNIVRAIVSQLQVDTAADNLRPSKMNSLAGEENSAIFKTMEDSIDGECEVLYTINPLPKYAVLLEPELAPQPRLAGNGQFIEIVKTRNFTNCQQRPVYNFGLPRSPKWEAGVNNMESFFDRSGYQRVLVSGSVKSYTIQSSVSVSKITLNPTITNAQRGAVWASTNVTLARVSPITEQMSIPENMQTLQSLVYTYTTRSTARQLAASVSSSSSSSSSSEEANATPRSRKASGSSSSSSSSESSQSISSEEYQQAVPSMAEQPNDPFLPLFIGKLDIQAAMQKAQEIAKQIGRDMQKPNDLPAVNTLDRFTILVDLIRTLPQKQLEELSRMLYAPKSVTPKGLPSLAYATWATYRDAVAQAGTSPALLTISSWIRETQYVQDEEAAQIMATVAQAARLPTVEYMKSIFELVKDSKVQSQYRLDETTLFTFCELLRIAHVDRQTAHNRYPIHVYGPFYKNSEDAIVKEFIPYIAAQLQKSVQQQDDKQVQKYIRALGKIAHPAIVPVFEPFLEGKQQMTTYQRTLVVMSMNKMSQIKPKLTRSVLYKIFSNKGEKYQVRVAAVYELLRTTNLPVSMLQSMAASVQEEPSHQVRSAIQTGIESLAKLGEFNLEIRESARAARNLLPRGSVGVQYSMANFTDYLVQGQDLSFEQDIFTIGSKDTLIPSAVFYRLNRQQNGAPQRPVKAEYMVSSPSDLIDSFVEIFSKHFPALAKAQPQQQAQVISEILKKLQVKEFQQEQVEGSIRFNLAGAERFFSFNNQTLERLAKIVHDKLDEAQYETQFSYHKLYTDNEVILALPLASGLPFVYTFKTPSFMALSGLLEVQGSLESREFSMLPKIQATFSTRSRAKLAILAPFSRKQYVAGHDRNIHASLPIQGEIKGKLAQNGIYEVQVTLKPKDISRQRLVHLSSWPYTSVQDLTSTKPLAEQSATQYIHVRQPTTLKTVFGSEQVALSIDATTEKDLEEYMDAIKSIQRVGVVGFLASSQSDLGLEHTQIDIYNEPAETKVSEINFVVALKKTTEQQKQQQQVSQEVQPDAALPTAAPKGIVNHAHLEEVFQKVRTGINMNSAFAVAVGLQLSSSSSKSQWSAVVAGAKSPVDEQARMYVYAQRSGAQEQDWQMVADTVVRMPQLPLHDAQKVLEAQKNGQIKTQVSWRGEQAEESRIRIEGQLEQTEEYKQYHREQLQNQNQQQQQQQQEKYQHILRTFSVFDKQSWRIRVQNIQSGVSQSAYQAYSACRYMAFPYISEDLQQVSEEATFSVHLQITPSLKHASLNVSTPIGTARFNKVPIHKYARPLIAVSPMHTPAQRYGNMLLREQFEATAIFEKDQITTFSNLTYPVGLGKVWHALMLSQPQLKYKNGAWTPKQVIAPFAILGRQNNGQQVKVILVDGTTIELSPAQGQMQVKVNEKELTAFPYYRQNPKVQVYMTQYNEVQVVMEHVKITHDGVRVRVQADDRLRGKLLGLFGRHSGEKYDLITPQMKYVQQREDAVASFAIDAQGELAQRQQMTFHASAGAAYEPSFANYVSEQDAGRADSKGRAHQKPQRYNSSSGSSSSSSSSSSSESNESGKPSKNAIRRAFATGCEVQRVHVLEIQGKHCFSTKAVPSCKPQCKVTKTQPQIAKFVCFEKNLTTDHWKAMALRGASMPNLEKKSNVESMTYEAHVDCSY